MLAYYEKTAESFWQGERDHVVSQIMKKGHPDGQPFTFNIGVSD